MAADTTTLLMILGGVVGVAGLGILAWALFRDRARGRRRCPRCWYDMSGVPGLLCPECGRPVKNERRLFRTRRRWRLAALAALLIAAGLATGITPRVRDKGWWSLVPTTVLLLLAPPENDMVWVDVSTGRTHEDKYAKELGRRFMEGRPWRWQWRMGLDACDFLRARSTWPVDEPFAVRIELPEWIGAGQVELEPELTRARQLIVSSVQCRGSWHTIGYLEPGTKRVRIKARLRAGGWSFSSALIAGGPNPAIGVGSAALGGVLYEGVFTVPVRPVATLEESMRAVAGERIDATIRRALRVRLGWSREGAPYRPAWVLLDMDRESLAQHSMIALPLTVELARDGAVVASVPTSLGMNEMALPRAADRRAVRLEPEIRRALEAPGSALDWTIRIRGELPEMHTVWQRETYWRGEIVLPLADVLEGPWDLEPRTWQGGK